MAIINRFTRLFKADVHAMLDRLEEPEALLRQALREMEDEVRENTRCAKLLEQQITQNKARIDELKQIVDGIGAQLDLCFEAGNTVLAKNLVRRRLENQRIIDYLQKQLDRQSEDLDKIRRLTGEQSQKLEALRQQAAVYDSGRQESGHADCQRFDILGAEAGMIVSDQDVEIALLEERKRRLL